MLNSQSVLRNYVTLSGFEIVPIRVKSRAWIGAQLTICAQKWRNSVRVRNSANPCVRDMTKYLRTSQMSVHGYPADMSFFCNLQLDLLKLQEDTPQADIDQDNVSLAGVLQGAVGRAVWYHRVRARRCWPIMRGFLRCDTIAGGTGMQSFSISWTQILRQLK